jgi:hypothetical protein
MFLERARSASRLAVLTFTVATVSTAPAVWLHSPVFAAPAIASPCATAAASADAAPPPARAASLPDLSVFLLGSGLALLIALLAWGEQIRAITKDTRDLERDFLGVTGLTRSHLNALLQARDDNERLVAFTSIMASGSITTALQVEILPLFERWRAFGSKLRRLQSAKYWLTICLTVVFLLAGALAALQPDYLAPAGLLAMPGVLTSTLLVTVVCAGRVEGQLNQLLVQIAEKV